jgi:cytochrome P450
MLAGHETTSTALSWALLEICQHPELQAELCAELRALPLPRASAGCAPLDADTLGALDKLPLLDAVLRETLRLHPPTTDTPRAPTHDVAVPLARPFVDAHGAAQDTLHIPAGVTLYVPISTVNRAEDLWGPDAMEWKCAPRRASAFLAGADWVFATAPADGLEARRKLHAPCRPCGATS